jgi:hypothetical protein
VLLIPELSHIIQLHKISNMLWFSIGIYTFCWLQFRHGSDLFLFDLVNQIRVMGDLIYSMISAPLPKPLTIHNAIEFVVDVE